MQHRVTFCAFGVFAAMISFAAVANPQNASVSITGAVVDSSSGFPLTEVSIYVDGNHLAARSDTTGEFGFITLPTGPHTLHLIKPGYTPRTYQFTITEGMAGEIDVGVGLLSQGPPPAVPVSGSVVDAVSGQAVIAARVTVNGGKTTFSGEGGAFFLAEPDLTWGQNWLEFRSIGYEPMVAALWVLSDETATDLDAKLVPHAVRLSEVVVEGERTTYAYGRIRHFYRRKRTGFGEFVTRADIERIRPIFVSSLLQRIPGVMAVSSSDGGRAIRMFGRRGYCRPLVYWNGIRTDDLDIDMFWPEDLEGIEVFRGPSEIPPEFNATGSACGVVVIWTK